MDCDTDVRANLFNNIVLSGGTTCFPGFDQRLTTELENLSGLTAKIDSESDRKHSVWCGGSILASLNTFHDNWVTQKGRGMLPPISLTQRFRIWRNGCQSGSQKMFLKREKEIHLILWPLKGSWNKSFLVHKIHFGGVLYKLERCCNLFFLWKVCAFYFEHVNMSTCHTESATCHLKEEEARNCAVSLVRSLWIYKDGRLEGSSTRRSHNT